MKGPGLRVKSIIVVKRWRVGICGGFFFGRFLGTVRSRPAIAPPIVRGRHASQNAERLKLDATTVFEADEPREEVERLRG